MAVQNRSTRFQPFTTNYLNSITGSDGEVYFNSNTRSLRTYNGRTRGGHELALNDFSNVTNEQFATKALAAGVGSNYSLPTASTSTLGGVKVDGTSITITNGIISAAGGLGGAGNTFGTIAVNGQSTLSADSINDTLTLVAGTGMTITTDSTNDTITFSSTGGGGSTDLTSFSVTSASASGVGSLTYNNLNGQFTFRPADFTNLSSIATTGVSTFGSAAERIVSITNATDIMEHNYSLGSVFYHTAVNSSFIANFTNLPTTNDRIMVVALAISQQGTAYIPIQIRIGGITQVVEWIDGLAPVGTPNKIDLISYSFLRSASSWRVLGNYAVYG